MRLIFCLILFCSATQAWASGWTDYELPITPEHAIVRANDMDVMLGTDTGEVIIYPGDYPNVGPIVEYAVSYSHIYTKNAGRVMRHDFPGDTYENVDYSQTYYFVVDRKTNSVAGPYSATEFQADPNVVRNSPIVWKEPVNPNFFLPLFGALMFLIMAAVLLGWPLLVLLPFLLITYFGLKRRRAMLAQQAVES